MKFLDTVSVDMERPLKKIIQNLLALLGYRISKIDPDILPFKNMDQALGSLAKRHQIKTIVDVGASNGLWSLQAMQHYPLCQYLLIEAQPVHETALKHFVALHSNSQYVLAAAGDRQGQIYFNADDPFSGQASFIPNSANSLVVPVTSVDNEINNRGLPGPYLLKLDTHGFEVPILKGASKTIRQAEVIIMECYNFKIGPDCLLFYEMCNYVAKLGFRCIDLVDPFWRPYDFAFWQMDLIFIRENGQEFSYNEYR